MGLTKIADNIADGIWTEIAGSIVELYGSKIYSALNEHSRIAKVLEKVGLNQLDSTSFDSIYAHALLSIGEIWESRIYQNIFTKRNVREAFFNAHYKGISKVKDEIEDGKNIIDYLEICLVENPKLWKYEITKEELQRMGQKIWDAYKDMVKQAMNPKELEMYQSILKMALDMAILKEAELRNSFEYQVSEHLRNFKEAFHNEFLKKDYYIPINGETRVFKSQAFSGITEEFSLEYRVQENSENSAYDSIFSQTDRLFCP